MRPSRFASFRNAFFSGLFLVAPLAATLFVFSWLVSNIGGYFRPLFPFMPKEGGLEAVWNFLITVLVLLLITALGYGSRYVFGRYFGGMAERFIQSIPGVGAVYTSIKQIVDTFGGQNRHGFSKVVLVEFPRKGSWSIGFLTGTARGELSSRLPAGLASVFVPTTPNPTSGFLVYVPRGEIVELDMSVGDGMKMLISGGAVVPSWSNSSVPPVVAEVSVGR
ncbi:MAG TPA: DUF502 domain-containing protein [Opitutaceae bacterium]|nr:DUF502 domain-containing protein [Opitutaceae bacterium]